MNKYKREILIVGGCGIVGSHVDKKLYDSGIIADVIDLNENECLIYKRYSIKDKYYNPKNDVLVADDKGNYNVSSSSDKWFEMTIDNIYGWNNYLSRINKGYDDDSIALLDNFEKPYLKVSDVEKVKGKRKYKIAFICTNTPYYGENNVCDIFSIEKAIKENDSELYIIKSTVLPGTIDYLKNKYHKHIIHSPEYYGVTQHSNNINFEYTIFGGDEEDCNIACELYKNIYNADHKFTITDSKTSELSKYMVNSYLANKVVFCNAFNELAKNYGVNYNKLREIFITDPRINSAFTYVYNDKPYYDSHCFNKDVKAIAKDGNSEYMKFIDDYNDKLKKKKTN